MKNWRGIFILLGLATGMIACQKSNNNSPYPQISLISFRPDSVSGGNPEDTALIFYRFFDGDGDLGVSAKPTNDSYIIVKDSRFSNDSFFYDMPSVDPGLVDKQKGMEGNSMVAVFASLLPIRADTVHTAKGDTLTLTLYVVDNAGHKSNEIITPRLLLRP